MPSMTPPSPPAARGRIPASLPRPDRHKPRCGEVRPSKVGKRRAFVLILVHVLVGLHFLHWAISGTSVTPVEPSESMQTLEQGKVNAGFLLFVAAIALTLVFGRWFCGWTCHVVAWQDLCRWLLAKVGLAPRPVRSRLLVFAPFAVAFYMFVWPTLKRWSTRADAPELHLELYTDELWQTFPGWIMSIASIAVVGFLIVWWLGAKGFCTYGCPYGAFFTIADRFSPMRVKVTDACDGCGHCTNVCTSNVRVHEEVARHKQIVDPGCMKCLDCVSVCPKDALHIGFAVPKPFVSSQQRLQVRADFTWPEELALAVVAVGATQWTFRGAWFGEGVPLLLAVGLGVITAVFALLLWRLLTRREMAFQNTSLKRDGKMLPAGRWALLLLVAWLGLTAHTFVGQRLKFAALEVASEPLQERFGRRQDVARERFETAHASVDGALSWDLIDDPELLQTRGLLRRELLRHDEAIADLVAALDAVPQLEYAGTALAVYRMRDQQFDEAYRLARTVLEHHPDNRTALTIVQRLEARPK